MTLHPIPLNFEENFLFFFISVGLSYRPANHVAWWAGTTGVDFIPPVRVYEFGYCITFFGGQKFNANICVTSTSHGPFVTSVI